MFRRAALHLVLGGALALSGCERRRAAVESPVETMRYDGRGVVLEARPTAHKVVIAHEAIPGYMEAMTMEFEAVPSVGLEDVQRGDAVTFRLAITSTRGWVEELRKTGHTALPAPTRAAPSGAEVGALLRDCALLDQSGQPLRLSALRGRALAITFIYTRCPFPDFCPRMHDQFRAVQTMLAADRARAAWSLLSITIDPQYDTPERLAVFAQRYEADPAHWLFLTGDAAEIEKLSEFFGVAMVRNGAEWNHNLRTVVIDPAGRVQKIFAGNEWKPSELADEMKRALNAAP